MVSRVESRGGGAEPQSDGQRRGRGNAVRNGVKSTSTHAMRMRMRKARSGEARRKAEEQSRAVLCCAVLG